MSDELLPDQSAQDSAGRARRIRWVLLIAAVAVAGWGIADRLIARTRLAQATLSASIPVVSVAHPKAPGDAENLVLPGNTLAYSEASLYARTSGYLRAWHKDIGEKDRTHVKSQ